MSNPSKAKGTAAETALLRYAHQNGFPHADRQPLRGNRDQGDLALCPGVVVEVKNHSGMPALGQPSAAVLAQWMNQTEVERTNARAAIGLLVVKRKGTTDPGRWFAYLPIGTLSDLTARKCLLPAMVAVAFIAAAERPEIRTPKGTPLPGPVAGFEPPAATPTPRAPRCEHHPDVRLIGGICHECTNFTPAPRPADWAERVKQAADEAREANL